jgi:hypothetical protein
MFTSHHLGLVPLFIAAIKSFRGENVDIAASRQRPSVIGQRSTVDANPTSAALWKIYPFLPYVYVYF